LLRNFFSEAKRDLLKDKWMEAEGKNFKKYENVTDWSLTKKDSDFKRIWIVHDRKDQEHENAKDQLKFISMSFSDLRIGEE
jgi:histidinol phosphatase-like enzyme